MLANWWSKLGTPATNCRLVEITPKLAGEWLERNTGNRPLKEHAVNKLIRAIDNGEWSLNGETIVFDNTGRLIQGQHRLKAVWQSGKAVLSYVIFDIDDADAFSTYDSGKLRSASDVLAIDGKHETSILASVCSKLILWERGTVSESSIFRGSSSASARPSNMQILEFARINESRIMTAIRATGGIDLAAPSLLATCYCIFNDIDKDKCAVFFSRLKTGEMLSSGSPILTLRNDLLRRKTIASSQSETRATAKAAKLTGYETMAYIIKAWNAYYLGKEMRSIRFPHDEAFPAVIDDKLFGCVLHHKR